MSIEKLQRVMWRIRRSNPGKVRIHRDELKRAVIKEIGTDHRTLKNNTKVLHILGWIRTASKNYYDLTSKDLEES